MRNGKKGRFDRLVRAATTYQDVFPGIEEAVCVLRSRRDGPEVLKDRPERRQPVRRHRQAPRAEPVEVQFVHCCRKRQHHTSMMSRATESGASASAKVAQ